LGWSILGWEFSDQTEEVDQVVGQNPGFIIGQVLVIMFGVEEFEFLYVFFCELHTISIIQMV